MVAILPMGVEYTAMIAWYSLVFFAYPCFLLLLIAVSHLQTDGILHYVETLMN
jgi:hypothetical protein